MRSLAYAAGILTNHYIGSARLSIGLGTLLNHKKSLLLAILILSLSISVALPLVSADDEHVSIVSVESPTNAVPNQRVLVRVTISYSFRRQTEIGLSISTSGATSSTAVSRGGLVNPARGDALSGTRWIYMAILLPSQNGVQQYTVRSFYARGSGWIVSDGLGKQFSIEVTNSKGFVNPSNSFVGSLAFQSPSKHDTPNYASIQSIDVTKSGPSLSFSLSIHGRTTDAMNDNMVYRIGIDATNTGSSVQNGQIDFQIVIDAHAKSASLQLSDGTVAKSSLTLTTEPNTFVVKGITINDLKNSYSFSLNVGAIRKTTVTTTVYTSGGFCDIDYWWNSVPSELNYCGGSLSAQTSTSTVVETLGISPAGGWIPVTLPSLVTVNTPGQLMIDNVAEQPINGVLQVSVPAGRHLISAQSLITSSDTTRQRFDRWDDGSTSLDRLINIVSDTTLQASYVTQHLLSVQSELPAAGAGWYDAGSTAVVSVPSETVPMDGILGTLGGKWNFEGWYENGHLLTESTTCSISMKSGTTAIARWHGDYSSPLMITAIVIGLVAVLLIALRTKRRPTKKRTRKRIR